MDYSPYRMKNFYPQKNDGKNKPSFEVGKDVAYKSSVKNSRDDCDVETSVDYFSRSSRNTHSSVRDTNSKGTRSKRDKKGLFIVVTIILCFLTVVAATEFITGGFIMNGIKSAFSPGLRNTYYYVVSEPYPNEYKAGSYAAIAKEAGGAGYIYVENEKYFVVIATYFDKKTAEKVAAKNEGTGVKEIEIYFPLLNSATTRDTELAEKVFDTVISKINRISVMSQNLDARTQGTTEVMTEVSSIRNELLLLKGEVAESSLGEDNLNKINGIIDPVFGALDAIVSSNIDKNLAGTLRYAAAIGVAALSVR